MGVDRSTVSKWEENTNRSNVNFHIASIPDLRKKVSGHQREEIYWRVQSGEKKELIAQDYDITPRRVAQIVAEEKAKNNGHDPVARAKQAMAVTVYSHRDLEYYTPPEYIKAARARDKNVPKKRAAAQRLLMPGAGVSFPTPSILGPLDFLYQGPRWSG